MSTLKNMPSSLSETRRRSKTAKNQRKEGAMRDTTTLLEN